MCGKTPKTPKVVERDPVAEQLAADMQSTRDANADTVAQRRRRKGSSLLTGAANDTAAPLTALARAQAKPTLLGGG
jgi:hypothetical protein